MRCQRGVFLSVRVILAAVALVSATTQAQVNNPSNKDPQIAGIIRDSAGKPIAEAEVAVLRNGRMLQFMTTTADGKFLLTGVAAAVVPVRIRRVGYTMQAFDVDTRAAASRSLEIVLTPVAPELEEVTVSGRDYGKLREFYQRREQSGGFARFLEQTDILRSGVTRSSELFRSTPGVVLRSSAGGNTLRIRDCQPMVWLDGQRVPGAELDEVIGPTEIAAIEFYPSNAGVPAQYTERQNRLCGTILVWSRTQ